MIRRTLLSAALLAGALLLPAAPAKAGTVELFNDEVIEGTILSVNSQWVVVRIAGGGTVRYPMNEVRDVRSNSGQSILRTLGRRSTGSSARPGPAGASGGLGATGSAGVTGSSGPFGASGAAGASGAQHGSGLSSVRPAGFDASFSDPRFSLSLPASFQATRIDADAVVFGDEGGALPWTLNVTCFSSRDGDFELIRSRARSELERIAGYRAARREAIAVGAGVAERTTGLYERDGRAIRHDQLVVQSSSGVLVIHFFSPGATLDEGAVPEVEAVIRSIKLK